MKGFKIMKISSAKVFPNVNKYSTSSLFSIRFLNRKLSLLTSRYSFGMNFLQTEYAHTSLISMASMEPSVYATNASRESSFSISREFERSSSKISANK